MFFRKKTTSVLTPLDNELYKLNEEWYATMRNLIEQTEKVIVCNGAIDLYPEGADKQAAIHKAEYEKQGLLRCIAEYEEATKLYNKAITSEAERVFTAEWREHTKKSHVLVEETYRNFFKRK